MRQVDDAGDATPKLLGELLGGDNILVVALRVGDDQANSSLVVGIEGMGKDDLARVEAVKIG